jgi:hypothetical protein
MVINERDLKINPNTTKVSQLDKLDIKLVRSGNISITKGSQIRLEAYKEALENEIRGLK